VTMNWFRLIRNLSLKRDQKLSASYPAFKTSTCYLNLSRRLRIFRVTFIDHLHSIWSIDILLSYFDSV
jgi:hypothetical protein